MKSNARIHGRTARTLSLSAIFVFLFAASAGLLFSSCDSSRKSAPIAAGVPFFAQNPGQLVVDVVLRYAEVGTVAKLSETVIDEVRAVVLDSTGNLVADAELTIVDDRYAGRLEVPVGNNMTLQVGFLGDSLLRWYGVRNGVNINGGAVTRVEVVVNETQLALSGPEIVNSGDPYELSWSSHFSLSTYALIQSDGADFQTSETIYTGTDTSFYVDGTVRSSSKFYRVSTIHPLGVGLPSNVVGVAHTKPKLSVEPDTVSFPSLVDTASLSLVNIGDGVLKWEIEPDSTPGWLQASLSRGEGVESKIELRVDRSGLEAGERLDEFAILSNAVNAQRLTIPVVVQVPEAPVLVLSETELDFRKGVTELSFFISNGNNGVLSYEIETTEEWITVSHPAGKVVPGDPLLVTVVVDKTVRVAGTYDASLQIRGGGGGKIDLRITIENAPILTVVNDRLRLSSSQPTDILLIRNSGTGLLKWEIVPELPSWLRVSPLSGITLDEVDTILVTGIDRGLEAEIRSFELYIMSEDETLKSLPIDFNVEDRVELETDIDRLSISLDTETADLKLSNTGNKEVEWSIQIPDWLSVVSTQQNVLSPGSSVTLTLRAYRLGLRGPAVSEELVVSFGQDRELRLPVMLEVPIGNLELNGVDNGVIDFGTIEDESSVRDLSLRNSGTKPVAWHVDGAVPDWLEVSTVAGDGVEEIQGLLDVNVEQELRLSVIRDKLDVGINQFTLVFRSDGIDEEISVLIKAVQDFAELSVTPMSLVLLPDSARAFLSIANMGVLPLQWSVGPYPIWLTISESNGEVSPGEQIELQIDVDRTSVNPEEFPAKIEFISNDPDSPTVVEVHVKFNDVPVANARIQGVEGGEKVSLGSTIVLDGRESLDADGDGLSFKWSSIDAEYDVSDSTSEVLEFTASTSGRFQFTLQVFDGFEWSRPDTVGLWVNSRPVADAGSDIVARYGDTITLDGSESRDIDGDALSYRWESKGTDLTDYVTVTPTLIIRNTDPVTVSLIVNDGELDSEQAEIDIQIEKDYDNLPPVAVLVTAIDTVSLGSSVVLDGSGSRDPDRDFTLSYEWAHISDQGIMTPLDENTPTVVVVPKQEGAATYQLQVYDGQDQSEVVQITFFVVATDTDAGPPETGDVVVLGTVEQATGDVVVSGTVEQATGDVVIAGEVVDDSGTVEIKGEIDE